MLASPLESLRINRRSMSVISPLRRYVTTGNLAIVLFVTLAVLGTIRGKETETTKTALANPPRAKLSSITSAFHRTRSRCRPAQQSPGPTAITRRIP